MLGYRVPCALHITKKKKHEKNHFQICIVFGSLPNAKQMQCVLYKCSLFCQWNTGVEMKSSIFVLDRIDGIDVDSINSRQTNIINIYFLERIHFFRRECKIDGSCACVHINTKQLGQEWIFGYLSNYTHFGIADEVRF